MKKLALIDTDSSSGWPTAASLPASLNFVFKTQIYAYVERSVTLMFKALLITMTILFLRKCYMGHIAVKYVQKCWPTLSPEVIKSNPAFNDLLADLRSPSAVHPPAIFILNQFALPMTQNWLCNTVGMPGVHERAVFVTLDVVARDTLRRRWPNIRQFYFPNDCFKDSFTFGDGAYQALYSLRANLAAALAESNQPFWMMQQDTFWRDNLFDVHLEDQGDYDILFDQLGADDTSVRSGWVNGANFYVRPSPITIDFFRRIGHELSRFYAPDMGMMVLQCHLTMKNSTKCAFIPRGVVNCWEWLDGDRSNPPLLMQLDCETDNLGKIGQMKKMGFYFVEEDKVTCNATAVDLAALSVETGTVPWEKKSYGRVQFTLVWKFADFVIQLPIIGALVKPILPALGFYIMLTV